MNNQKSEVSDLMHIICEAQKFYIKCRFLQILKSFFADDEDDAILANISMDNIDDGSSEQVGFYVMSYNCSI